MKKVKLISLVIVIAMVAVSCKKETGPQGAQGAQGPAGPAGTTNVIYSNWKGFAATSWRPVVEFGKNMEIYPASVPALDQNIIDHGAVLVYIKFINAQAPIQLPLTMAITSSGNQFVGYRLIPDSIQMMLYDLDDNLDPGTWSGDSSQNAYRYIIIPGGTVGSKHMLNNNSSQPSLAELKNMTYAEVCRYYNIPE
jgi:hypothetical protein